MVTTERIARLVFLLSRRRCALVELRTELDVSHDQLRRDLDAIRRAGWLLREEGRPKTVWIEGVLAAPPVEDVIDVVGIFEAARAALNAAGQLDENCVLADLRTLQESVRRLGRIVDVAERKLSHKATRGRLQ